MKRVFSTIRQGGIIVLLLLLGCAFTAVAAEAPEAPATEEAPAPAAKPKGPSKLLGAPVNINIAGGGILPEGKLLTALNWSLRDRTTRIRGSNVDNPNTPDMYTQVWLMKIRYGLYDWLEINTVVPYSNNKRDGMHPKHIEGIGDMPVGFSAAILSERRGDPLWVTFSGGLLLPTGQGTDNNPPGNDAWGGRAALSFTKMFTPNIKGDMDLVTQGPFERGNQEVKRGQEYQWNMQLRYLFEQVPFDIGLESSWTKVESGDRKLPAGNTINTQSGTTEWVVGPSVNVAIEPLGMWAGFGTFFPVQQDAKGSTKMENVRWEFKIAKIW